MNQLINQSSIYPCNPTPSLCICTYRKHYKKGEKKTVIGYSYPNNINPGPFEDLVAQLLLFSLFVCHLSRVEGHLGKGSCGATLRERARIDHQDAFDYLSNKQLVISQIRALA